MGYCLRTPCGAGRKRRSKRRRQWATVDGRPGVHGYYLFQLLTALISACARACDKCLVAGACFTFKLSSALHSGHVVQPDVSKS